MCGHVSGVVLVLELVVVLRHVRHDAELVRHLVVCHVLHSWQSVERRHQSDSPGGPADWQYRAQSRQDGRRGCCSAECPRVEAVVVNKLRSKVVEDGTEGEAGPEGPGHVLDPDVVVAGHHSPYPDLNGL